MNREYEIDGVPVGVAIFLDERLDRGHSLLSPKNALPGPGWSVEDSGQAELYPGGGEVTFNLLRQQHRQLLSYSWYEGLRSPGLEILRNALGLDHSPWRQKESLLAVRLSTPLRGSNRKGLEAARKRLARAARGLEKANL